MKFRKGNVPWNKNTKGFMPVPWNKGKKGFQVAWNKGLMKETDSRVAKISETLTGTSITEERRKNLIESHKGQTAWNKGIPCSQNTKDKLKKANKGQIPWNAGKHRSEKTKEKVRRSGKKLWQNLEYARMMLKTRNTNPTKSELRLNSILQEILPNEYSLNVKANIMVLGGKVPDFVNVNGQKKVIEMFGEYWHNSKEEQERIDLFKKFGWSALIIWEHELENINNLKAKLKEFCNA